MAQNPERYEYGDATYVAEVVSNPIPAFQCETCGKRFHREAQYNRHLRNQHGPKVHCMYPGCTYQVATGRAYRLRSHVLTHRRKLERLANIHQTTTETTSADNTASDRTTRQTTTTDNTVPDNTTLYIRPRTPTQDLLTEPASQWRSPQVTITDDQQLDYSPSGSVHSLVDLSSVPEWETILSEDLDIYTNTVTTDPVCTLTSTQNSTDTTDIRTQSTGCTLTSTQNSTDTTDFTAQSTGCTTTSTQTNTETADITTQTSTGTRDTTTQTAETTTLHSSTTDTSIQTDPIKTHHLSGDPHYYFIGAPSHYMEGETATLLRQTRTDAQQHTDRYRRRFVPYGYACMMKRESVSFPDGRVYVLEDCWVRQPASLRMRESGCQTDDVDVGKCMTVSEKVQDEPLDLSVRKCEE